MTAVESPPATGRRCPRCGAGLTERQEWCLHCGSSVGARVVAAPGWRTPIVLAGLLLAVTAAALALAIVTLADDTTTVAQAPPAAATPAPTVTPAPTEAPTTTPEAGATPTPTPEAGATATATPAPTETPTPTETPSGASTPAGVESWPQGESGWTVVLASERTRSQAVTKAENFANGGTSGVGILDSDDFSSLTGGYWVVYAGRHPTRQAAEDALQGIDAPDAYVRQVTPR